MQEKISEQNREQSINDDDENKYVVFELGNELYGARIADVREVVQLLPIKPVPNTIGSFVGVCNLKGQIVGVIDLRQRFSTKSTSSSPVMLVTETNSGAICCIVDAIRSVSNILPEDIERSPNIIATIPMKYIYGIGKYESRLVTLIQLPLILSSEELTSVEHSRMAVGEF